MFEIMQIVIPIIIAAVFIITFVLILSPKARGKFMSKQIKATRYMMDESEEDLRNISTNMAQATKEGVEITSRAIKDGFTENDTMFCKHCGSKIDMNSKFCNSCGEKQ